MTQDINSKILELAEEATEIDQHNQRVAQFLAIRCEKEPAAVHFFIENHRREIESEKSYLQPPKEYTKEELELAETNFKSQG